uniref:Uncharacterized protein TCIL3000_8_6320 n=1 Tax=Trypanosoma congolense (strain IL3000) TaxID=1068625 RepID=G0USP2_TRYCI|nr:unnamed protein product [Trypanosoma congolense IL3000]
MKFVSHPNIVKLKEVIDDTESHKVYVIMEYCVNGPVHIHGDPPLPMEKVRRYGNNILAGLQHLHAQYLFHWDIKPANCLVDAEDVAKIADFGACGHSSRGRSFGGTPAYSCPEQFAGAHVTGDVADSWAFAMTLYQMSHGTLAYSVTCIGNLRDSLLDPTPLPIRKDLEPELHDLLSQMLDKDVSKRLMLNEAVQHPYFAESLGQPPTSESPNELCGASIEDLYARAQEAVLRGKRVGQYFHGVPSIRRMRQMMVRDIATCEAEDMDDTLVDGFELTSMESNPRFVANPADEEEVREIVNSFLQDSTREMVRIEDIFMPSMHPFIADTAASLVKLCLTNNRLFTMEGVDFSKFQHLRTLYVTKNALKFFPVEVIAAPQLTYLDLSYNSIVDVPTALSEARMLRTLCLNHNQIRHVGGDENGMSVFSGPSMQKVLLSANPLAHLPAEIVTCPAVELTVDDAPSLLEEWYTMVNCTTYVNIRWNDIYPCRVYPEVPLFVASKSVKLYNLTMLEALDVRNVVLLQFKSWIPVGEVEAGDMEMHLQALQRGVAKSVANDGNSISQMRSTRRTVVCNGEMFPVPQIFSKSVTRFLHSYFVMDEEPADQASVYNALRNYLTTRLSRKESVVVFVDERKASQMTRDTIVAVLCEVLTEAMGSEVTLGCCLNDVVDAIRGIYV